MIGFHVTTPKKYGRYQKTGAILPPVRWWSTRYSAEKWMRKTNRNVLLAVELPKERFPLPIHGGAWWTDQIIRKWYPLQET